MDLFTNGFWFIHGGVWDPLGSSFFGSGSITNVIKFSFFTILVCFGENQSKKTKLIPAKIRPVTVIFFFFLYGSNYLFSLQNQCIFSYLPFFPFFIVFCPYFPIYRCIRFCGFFIQQCFFKLWLDKSDVKVLQPLIKQRIWNFRCLLLYAFEKNVWMNFEAHYLRL